MILDHIGFGVNDFETSRAFYLAALRPLGGEIIMEGEETSGCGFGRSGKPELWLYRAKKAPSTPLHLAFVAESRADVQAFYKAALAAGGRDNGAPGLREHYHPAYYAAFVRDPDGHNVEAVCHKPE